MASEEPIYDKISSIQEKNVNNVGSVSLGAGNTVSKHKWGYKLQNVPAVAVPLDPLASYIYIMHETSCTCLQPRPNFA